MRTHRYLLNRIKVILCVLALGLAAIPARAASWVGLYGGDAFDSPEVITATLDGGFVLAAYTESFGHGSEERPDILLLKLDGQGVTEWQEVIGTPGHTDEAFSIIEARDGRILVAGLTYSATTGFAQAWVVALKPNGKIAWQRAYDGQYASYARSIAECPDGGFILCGVWWAQSETHPWALRIDFEGNVLWQRAFGKGDGSWEVNGEWYSVLPDADGGYFVWGWYRDYRPDPDIVGGHLAKLDADGNIAWQRLYQGISGTNMVRTPDGGFVLAGNWNHNITRLDAQGNVLWNTTYTGTYSDLPRGPTLLGIVLLNPNGGYIVLGARGGPWLVGVSEEGIVEWEKVYDGARSVPGPHALCGAPGGGVAIAVYTDTWDHRIGVLKTDADFALSDPCSSTTQVRTYWASTPVTISETADLDPIGLEPWYADTTIKPHATSVNEAHSFCPVITKVRKLKDPFRLELTGSLFLDIGEPYTVPPYSPWWVTIDGVRVPEIKVKSDHKMILKGGKELKAMLPKGQPVCIRIVTLISYDPLYSSACYTYTRGGTDGEQEQD